MKEKDYKSHKKCSKEGCIKYAVKEGLCHACFNEEHGIVKKTGPKPKIGLKNDGETKILPPPEIKVRKKYERKHPPASPLLRGNKSEISVKSSIDINNLVGLLTVKRDLLKKEIIQIEATFVTLHSYAGIEIPELLVLNGP